MLFCIYTSAIIAPTKTQRVLGSNPSRITQQIIKSILKKRMLFCICAPTKTQWVLGSNPSRITQLFKSILFLRMLFLSVPRPKRNGSWVRVPAESQLSVLIREQGVETWLEASTERSESNPGRSLGIYTAYSDSCLEDSTSPRPSIRCQSDKSVFEKKTQ